MNAEIWLKGRMGDVPSSAGLAGPMIAGIGSLMQAQLQW